MFSPLQQLTPWTRKKRQQYRDALKHMEVATEIYNIQISEGRYMIHEQPGKLLLGSCKAVEDIKKMEGVVEVEADMCQYGLMTWARGKGRAPARKRTKFITNADCVADELERKCDGEHVHQPLVGGRAEKSRENTTELKRAMCRGIVKQLKMRKMNLKYILRLQASMGSSIKGNIEEQHDETEDRPGERMAAWDDLTGVP